MILIGVTGGVGTGKSTVAAMFKERGAHLLDADRIVHQFMKPKTPIWRALRSAFGGGILTPAGRIDRRKLGILAFRDPTVLRRLGRVIHPAVRRTIQERIRLICRRDRDAVLVLDIPLLIEAGSAYPVDALVVVSSSTRVATNRLKRRSGWSLVEVRQRQTFQLPLWMKEKIADFVINNNGSLATTRRQVRDIWNKIVKGEQ